MREADRQQLLRGLSSTIPRRFKPPRPVTKLDRYRATAASSSSAASLAVLADLQSIEYALEERVLAQAESKTGSYAPPPTTLCTADQAAAGGVAEIEGTNGKGGSSSTGSTNSGSTASKGGAAADLLLDGLAGPLLSPGLRRKTSGSGEVGSASATHAAEGMASMASTAPTQINSNSSNSSNGSNGSNSDHWGRDGEGGGHGGKAPFMSGMSSGILQPTILSSSAPSDGLAKMLESVQRLRPSTGETESRSESQGRSASFGTAFPASSSTVGFAPGDLMAGWGNASKPTVGADGGGPSDAAAAAAAGSASRNGMDEGGSGANSRNPNGGGDNNGDREYDLLGLESPTSSAGGSGRRNAGSSNSSVGMDPRFLSRPRSKSDFMLQINGGVSGRDLLSEFDTIQRTYRDPFDLAGLNAIDDTKELMSVLGGVEYGVASAPTPADTSVTDGVAAAGDAAAAATNSDGGRSKVNENAVEENDGDFGDLSYIGHIMNSSSGGSSNATSASAAGMSSSGVAPTPHTQQSEAPPTAPAVQPHAANNAEGGSPADDLAAALAETEALLAADAREGSSHVVRGSADAEAARATATSLLYPALYPDIGASSTSPAADAGASSSRDTAASSRTAAPSMQSGPGPLPGYSGMAASTDEDGAELASPLSPLKQKGQSLVKMGFHEDIVRIAAKRADWDDASEDEQITFILAVEGFVSVGFSSKSAIDTLERLGSFTAGELKLCKELISMGFDSTEVGNAVRDCAGDMGKALDALGDITY